MLDCGLDLTPSLSFLPLSVVESSRPRGEPVDKQGLEGELRDCGGTVLVDSQPEVLPPQEGLFNFCDIDAILISNYTCMLALPYITETKGFRGKVLSKHRKFGTKGMNFVKLFRCMQLSLACCLGESSWRR